MFWLPKAEESCGGAESVYATFDFEANGIAMDHNARHKIVKYFRSLKQTRAIVFYSSRQNRTS